MSNNYSEKEIIIFGGVLSLAQSGADISKITAKQIADAAGMGKATIYDYFSSKEEIIIGALLYSLDEQATQFETAMRETLDFKDKMFIILHGVIDKLEDSGSIFNILLNSGRQADLNKASADCLLPEFTQIIMRFMAILHSVLESGYNQGFIAQNIQNAQQKDYIETVLMAALFSVANQSKNKFFDGDRTKIIENAYTLLIKALA